MNDQWLPIDASLGKTKTEEIRGVKVEVSMSPYDVPIGVRGYAEENSDFFVIEFKYRTTDERTRSMPHRDHVFVEVGVNSRRIYRIKLDVKQLNCEAVALEVKEAIEQTLSELGPTASNRLADTYRLNESIILKNRHELFGATVPDLGGQACAVQFSNARLADKPLKP